MKFDKQLISPLTFLVVLILFIIFGVFVSDNLTESIIQNNSIFGIELQGLSLALVAFVIGLVDGFNPCAMWVLIYMITLLSQLDDKKKMIIVVSIFLFASGAMYFLILQLWYIGWISIQELLPPFIFQIVGLFAVGFGLYLAYDLWENEGKAECKIDVKKQRNTKKKIKSIISQPLTLFTIVSTILLAFIINSVEFVCSIGLPAIFTQLLTQTGTSYSMSTVYIGIYTLAFMLDDLLVFYFALKAIDPQVLTKYSAYSKGFGAIIIFTIGIIILFFPQLLAQM
ncbi:MAG: hypothetical protein ACLFPL_04510 [Candidatus Nanoarchaeia archaeon]